MPRTITKRDRPDVRYLHPRHRRFIRNRLHNGGIVGRFGQAQSRRAQGLTRHTRFHHQNLFMTHRGGALRPPFSIRSALDQEAVIVPRIAG